MDREEQMKIIAEENNLTIERVRELAGIANSSTLTRLTNLYHAGIRRDSPELNAMKEYLGDSLYLSGIPGTF